MKRLLFCLLFVLGCGETGELTFKQGDVVQLKSGGPKMTVNEDAYGNKRVYVVWFDDNGTLQSAYYYQGSLKKISD